MKPEKLLKELKSLGVIVSHKKRHYELRFKERRTIMIRHPSQEITNEYRRTILRQLGIK